MKKGTQIDIFNGGFVRYVDHMGTDEDIVEAARVSVLEEGKEKKYSSTNDLLRYMFRHGHSGPFEQVQVKFHLKVPMAIGEQILRHRTGKYNKKSGRYTEWEADFYIPDDQRIKEQAKSNKQGSGKLLDKATRKWVAEWMKQNAINSYKDYDVLLRNNVAKEIARFVLPANLYTEFYMLIDIHNLFNFFAKRLHKEAQEEARVVAEAMYSFVNQLFPLSCQAFEDYKLNAISLSATDILCLENLLSSVTINVDKKDNLMYDKIKSCFENKRERKEFMMKLKKIGLIE